ncbi:MAG TPA: dihydroorotate dehydrogenase [Nitrososphaeraceae archaeon]|nr:dihydroorotate dehydrogenase [Nitrososphaeraceae archaeon]
MKNNLNSTTTTTTNIQSIYKSSNMLSIDLAGIPLRNPLLLASGFLGISQQVFNRLYNDGLGAIVSKSISVSPLEGYKGPTVVYLGEKGYLNAVGLANPGSDVFAHEIMNNQIPLVVSIVGSSQSDFQKLINKFDKLNIVAYEVNLSCPHVEKMGMEVGDDPDLVTKIIKTIKTRTKKPVIIKVGIGKSDVLKLATIIQESGADAITAINTIKAMAINVETGMPVLSNKVGGLSGVPLKPIGVRCVYEIFKKVNIPVIGCGGIFTWEDAIEYILAGATAIELGSVIGYRGLKVFNGIKLGITRYLQKKDYKNVKEIIGLAHKY